MARRRSNKRGRRGNIAKRENDGWGAATGGGRENVGWQARRCSDSGVTEPASILTLSLASHPHPLRGYTANGHPYRFYNSIYVNTHLSNDWSSFERPTLSLSSFLFSSAFCRPGRIEQLPSRARPPSSSSFDVHSRSTFPYRARALSLPSFLPPRRLFYLPICLISNPTSSVSGNSPHHPRYSSAFWLLLKLLSHRDPPRPPWALSLHPWKPKRMPHYTDSVASANISHWIDAPPAKISLIPRSSSISSSLADVSQRNRLYWYTISFYIWGITTSARVFSHCRSLPPPSRFTGVFY